MLKDILIALSIPLFAQFATAQPEMPGPLAGLTRDWQTKQVGDITYHYPDSINLVRASAFAKKNETIAKKLGLTPEKIDFYLTDNYQQALTLLGKTADSTTASRMNNGYMYSGNLIFAIRHNEDFSHDLIHYYVAKIRTSPRNATAEEGLAYYWGNAYYVDANKNMIEYPDLISALRSYIQTHPDSSILSLFQNNPHPFTKLAPEISIRSIISARLFQLIEETKGVPGIMTLMNCGKGDDNYFNTLDSLTGINRSNLDVKLQPLLKSND